MGPLTDNNRLDRRPTIDPKISTQNDVVSAVNAESALENAAATIPILNSNNTPKPR